MVLGQKILKEVSQLDQKKRDEAVVSELYRLHQLSFKQVKNPILDEMAGHVRKLAASEVQEWLKGRGESEKWLFPPGSSFEVNGRIYGFAGADLLELHAPEYRDPRLIKALIYDLDQAAGRMSGIVEGFGTKGLPIRIKTEGEDADRCMSKVEAIRKDIVEIDIDTLRSFAEALRSGYYAFAENLQGRYFHELIHGLRFHGEAVPMLGQFLYSPETWGLGDPDRIFTSSMFERLRNRRGWYGDKPHDLEWAKTVKILLWEYDQLDPKLQVRGWKIPESLLEQKKLVSNIDYLYELVPEDARYKILGKYLKMSDEEVDKLAFYYTKKLNLDFLQRS